MIFISIIGGSIDSSIIVRYLIFFLIDNRELDDVLVTLVGVSFLVFFMKIIFSHEGLWNHV